MSNWDESKHKRKPKGSPKGGQFAKTSDGAGGTHKAIGDMSADELKRELQRELSEEKPQLVNADEKIGRRVFLPKEEYAVLRAEVMRKNAAQMGKVKPTNYAFTANYFYVYSTTGDDSFIPIMQLDIETKHDKIDEIVRRLR